MNWPQVYMCPLHPEAPSHLPESTLLRITTTKGWPILPVPSIKTDSLSLWLRCEEMYWHPASGGQGGIYLYPQPCQSILFFTAHPQTLLVSTTEKRQADREIAPTHLLDFKCVLKVVDKGVEGSDMIWDMFYTGQTVLGGPGWRDKEGPRLIPRSPAWVTCALGWPFTKARDHKWEAGDIRSRLRLLLKFTELMGWWKAT